MRVDKVVGLMGAARTPLDLFPGTGVVALLGDSTARRAAQSVLVSALTEGNHPWPRLIHESRVGASIAGTGETFELGHGSAYADERRRLHVALQLDGPSLALLWAGGPSDSLDVMVERGTRLLALQLGLASVENALGALVRLPGVEDALSAAEADPTTHPMPGMRTAAQAELARAERDLQVLRADAAEIHGDLDEATMEWLRERQDAETTLLAYRDRARELKVRLHQMEHGGPGTACPTCGRELDDHYDDVARELREEWESVVQDGRWWKKRHEQLELKPERVRDLENHALRSQAAIEDAAQKREHVRTALGVRENGGPEPRSGRTGSTIMKAAESLDDPPEAALVLSRLVGRLRWEARTTLLSATSHTLNRLSGGRLIGLDFDESSSGLLPRPVTGAAGREDLAAALVSVHLALARTYGGDKSPLGSLLVGEHFSDLEEEDQVRGVALLRRMRRRFPQIVVLPGAAVVDANPESFDAVWEFRASAESGLPALRSLPVGVGTITIGA